MIIKIIKKYFFKKITPIHLVDVINIGSWDMDSENTKTFKHNISEALSKDRIKEIFVTIYSDSKLIYNFISNKGRVSFNDNEIILYNSPFFDNSNFNNNIINRGEIYIIYSPLNKT